MPNAQRHCGRKRKKWKEPKPNLAQTLEYVSHSLHSQTCWDLKPSGQRGKRQKRGSETHERFTTRDCRWRGREGTRDSETLLITSLGAGVWQPDWESFQKSPTVRCGSRKSGVKGQSRGAGKRQWSEAIFFWGVSTSALEEDLRPRHREAAKFKRAVLRQAGACSVIIWARSWVQRTHWKPTITACRSEVSAIYDTLFGHRQRLSP